MTTEARPMRTLGAILLGTLAAVPLRAADPEAVIRRGLVSRDRALHVLDDWMRDPYIVRTPDGGYLLTGTRLGRVAGGRQGIQVWQSRDLVTWQDRGTLWHFGQSRWIGRVQPSARNRAKGVLLWAPEIHRLGDRWVLVHTTNSRAANLLVSRGADLEGPFDEPLGPAFGHHHDPSIFQDTDGRAWLVWNCARIQALAADLQGLVGPETELAPADRRLGHEGCLIRKIGPKYVLFGTAWSTDTMRHGTYNLYYCTADRVTGPYGPRRFAGRCLGHGTLFQDDRGQWWCTAFYNANRSPLSPEQIRTQDVSDTAYTLNAQGLTLVPMDVRWDGARVVVRALDPTYAVPGPEEAQRF